MTDDLEFDYKYGFKTDTTSFLKSKKGLDEEVINFISDSKNEPIEMREIRLKAYKEFLKHPNPNFGPSLEHIDFNDYTYYIKPTDRMKNNWDDVPSEIKDTFEKLGIPEAEAKYLAGTSTQFESEVVYHKNLKELDDKGVIFTDTDTALREHTDLFLKYFSKLVPISDNKYAALNTCVWSGGSFIYVPKGVKLDKPVQSYFRINSDLMGQFERTLIIVDEGAEIHYIEGCTAPKYSNSSLHAAVVEIFVHKDAKCRYSTVQNWSNNIINLVTKRALVMENGQMDWVDGNVGAGLNMKYPACILQGDNAKGTTISIAFASKDQYQDTGAKMIHIGKNTTSSIISKSISKDGGVVNYRGLVDIKKNAKGAKAHVECDTLLLDDISSSDTIPLNKGANSDMYIEHEATVSKVNEDQLFYLMSRGLTEEDATNLIIMGFIEPFSKELPMEYAVELNRLIKVEMKDSIC